MTLLPEVRQELYETAARRATRRPAGPARRRPTSGALVAAVAVAVAVAVAGVAIVALQHRPRAAAPAHAPASTSPVAAKPLVSMLSVLRRPQAATDRPAPSVLADRTGSDWRIDPALTRLARTVPFHGGKLRIYLYVGLPVRGARAVIENVPVTGAVVGGALVGPRGFTSGINLQSARLLARPRIIFGLGLTAEIVPDGVTAVRWVFAGARPGAPAVVVRPSVRDNVAVGMAPAVRGRLLDSVTWYGPGGRVLGTYDGVAARRRAAVGQQRLVARSVRVRVLPVLLRTLGVLRAPLRPGAPALSTDEKAELVQGFGFRLNVARARYVSIAGHGLWVVPGATGLCLGSLTGFESCSSTGALLAGQFNETSSSQGLTQLEGIVLDGNRTVSVVLAGGSVRRIPVLDNVYYVSLRRRPLAVIVRAASGRVVRVSL